MKEKQYFRNCAPVISLIPWSRLGKGFAWRRQGERAALYKHPFWEPFSPSSPPSPALLWYPTAAPVRKPDVSLQSTQDLTEKPIYTSLFLKFLPNPRLSAKCRRVENFTQMLFICQTFWCKVYPMVVEPPLLIKTFCTTINLSSRS